jgi:DNA invertase Pin-like site-specific DNA recombinase
MKYGYARVSSLEQNAAMQLAALKLTSRDHLGKIVR